MSTPVMTHAWSRRTTVLAVGAWAVLGNVLLFGEVAARLGWRAISTVRAGISAGQGAVLLALVVLVGYLEGYRVLHRRFAPAVLRRAREVAQRERLHVVHVVAAPLYAIGLFGAPRRTMMHAWLCVGLHVPVIALVRATAEPWRSIIDGAVATALLGLVISLVVRGGRSR